MTLLQYIQNINQRYKTGISREHSYRGDLQNLLEGMLKNVMVTNEPPKKWFKDRRGRTLSMEEIQHYQKIIVALVFLTGPSITKKRCKKIFRSTPVETQL